VSVIESDFVWITLLEKRVEFCRNLALEIIASKVEDGIDWGRNAAPPPEKSVYIETLGLCGEAAAMLYLSPINWITVRERKKFGLPDLECNGIKIDAKTRSRHDYDLVIQRNADRDWIYLLATGSELHRICLRAWCYGHEAMMRAPGTSAPVPGPNAYWINQGDEILKPMRELRILLHGRGAR